MPGPPPQTGRDPFRMLHAASASRLLAYPAANGIRPSCFGRLAFDLSRRLRRATLYCCIPHPRWSIGVERHAGAAIRGGAPATSLWLVRARRLSHAAGEAGELLPCIIAPPPLFLAFWAIATATSRRAIRCGRKSTTMVADRVGVISILFGVILLVAPGAGALGLPIDHRDSFSASPWLKRSTRLAVREARVGTAWRPPGGPSSHGQSAGRHRGGNNGVDVGAQGRA